MNRWARSGIVLVSSLTLALFADIAVAHTGGLALNQDPEPVPVWLTLMTGGGVIGMSFLFASLMTDHDLIREINGRSASVSIQDFVRTYAHRLAGWVGVAALGVIIVTGLIGPQNETTNLAILVVWVGWWAGYTMSVYLIGNSWPLLNPWRTLGRYVPRLGTAELPERLGVWPSVIGLLLMVYLEVVTPVAQSPRLLVGVILGYTAITLGGVAVYGRQTWFERIDPVARIFRYYGLVAPIQWTGAGLKFRVPGTAVIDHQGEEGFAGTAFIIAILWVTTYDGFVSTPAWGALIGPIVQVGVPALLVYFVALLLGYGFFLGIYIVGARLARRTGETYLKASFIGRELATSLLPIAAGYHLAHFLGYFLTLSPAMLTILVNPLSAPAQVPILSIPGWFSVLQLLFVLIGHVMAVWAAHSIAFDLFAGRLQPIRSQYPFIALMIFYTLVSMWIVTSPTGPPPYL